MPTAVSYPGVYIEEVPSGVRTIVGVATSITAFIGRAKGPVDKAVTITGFANYERQFGGLDRNSPMSYAVRDFFLNGGSTAVVVRLFKPPTTGTGLAKFEQATNKLKLQAANEGKWGSHLWVSVIHSDTTALDPADVLARFGTAADKLFDLEVWQGVPEDPTNVGKALLRERFVSLTNATDSPRRIDRVIDGASELVRVLRNANGIIDPPLDPNVRPDPVTKEPLVGGDDGQDLTNAEYTDGADFQKNKKGLFALETVDLFNLLVVPQGKLTDANYLLLLDKALNFCVERRAFLIVDAPAAWESKASGVLTSPQGTVTSLNLTGTRARNAAVYFPRIRQANPLNQNRVEEVSPSGVIASVFARTDATRGVWKAPAGLDAALNGIDGLAVKLTDVENGRLNPVGVNCLRTFPATGPVVWGSRTLRGGDALGDEYKYVPVRRFTLFLEESLYRGTQFAVFEPNDEPLWAQLRLNVGVFMNDLFRQGAFAGQNPRDAYQVKCDSETTTQSDINKGIVNIVVKFAPLKPAEFVVLKIQQLAGNLNV